MRGLNRGRSVERNVTRTPIIDSTGSTVAVERNVTRTVTTNGDAVGFRVPRLASETQSGESQVRETNRTTVRQPLFQRPQRFEVVRFEPQVQDANRMVVRLPLFQRLFGELQVNETFERPMFQRLRSICK